MVFANECIPAYAITHFSISLAQDQSKSQAGEAVQQSAYAAASRAKQHCRVNDKSSDSQVGCSQIRFSEEPETLLSCCAPVLPHGPSKAAFLPFLP